MSAAEAVACLQRGDAAGAEAVLARVLAADPCDVEALNLSAIARHQRGDLAGALEALDAALAVDAAQPSAHFNRANMLQALGRMEEAVAAYARALELAPDDVHAWINRAAAERALGRDAESAASCAQALRCEPNNTQALNDGAAALGRLERYDEASPLIDRLVSLTPDSASAHTNRGKILAGLERYEDACAAYEAALRVNPDHAPAWNNLGVARAALGRRAEAIEAYDRAAQIPTKHFDADHPSFNKAVALLVQGDYAQGFALYAQRFSAGTTLRPAAAGKARAWDGAPLDGVLRVMGEQGVGDQLLFARLLPLVLARTPRVAVDCDPRLVPLLRRAYPQLHAVLAPNEPLADAVAEIAMGDIAGVLHVAPADIAALPPVMRADEAKASHLRAKYAALAQGRPIVGVAWASPRAKVARSKSAAIEHWGALLREPHCFVSLQYGDAAADIEAARAAFGCDIYVDPAVNQLRSIDDFAAQLAALDHIVTISNTTAHVAGAVGLPCYVLAPPGRGLHWYWGVEGEGTPWYPSLRVLRRAVGAPWEGQIAAVAALLK